MIQITPQMRVLVAVAAVDGRKGMDALAPRCREKLAADPFPAAYSSSARAAKRPLSY